jgi:hypothetical protein
MKKCSTSLSIKETQIKTTLRFHLTTVRLAAINKINNSEGKENKEQKMLGRMWKEKGTLIYCRWKCKLI